MSMMSNSPVYIYYNILHYEELVKKIGELRRKQLALFGPTMWYETWIEHTDDSLIEEYWFDYERFHSLRYRDDYGSEEPIGDDARKADLLDAIYDQSNLTSKMVDAKTHKPYTEYQKCELLAQYILADYYLRSLYYDTLMRIFHNEANYGVTDDIVLLEGICKIIESTPAKITEMEPEVIGLVMMLANNLNDNIAERGGKILLKWFNDETDMDTKINIRNILNYVVETRVRGESPTQDSLDEMNRVLNSKL